MGCTTGVQWINGGENFINRLATEFALVKRPTKQPLERPLNATKCGLNGLD
jgi:hypothetical protein